MPAIKRDKRDKVFSNLVRERANWMCERCGTVYTPPTMALHCAHLFTRRNRSIRWHPDAAIAACYGCHQYIDSHPDEKERIACVIIGTTVYEHIRLLSSKAKKYKPWQLEELYRHLKREYELMMESRQRGFIGRIDFLSYEEGLEDEATQRLLRNARARGYRGMGEVDMEQRLSFI